MRLIAVGGRCASTGRTIGNSMDPATMLLIIRTAEQPNHGTEWNQPSQKKVHTHREEDAEGGGDVLCTGGMRDPLREINALVYAIKEQNVTTKISSSTRTSDACGN